MASDYEISNCSWGSLGADGVREENLGEHINVLVVDDLPDMRRSLQKELEKTGHFLVETAEDCANAMDKIRQHPIHVAIVDLNMPNFDGQVSPTAGIDLIRKVKKTNPEIAIIVLTAQPSVPTVKEALRLGAADYFEKGLAAKDLEGKVLSVLPEEMKEKLVEVVPINFNLIINFGSQTSLIKDEDEQVLRRLFLDASEINVVEIARGSKSTAIYRVDARDAKGWRAPVVVKMDWKDAVTDTKENFDEYVKGRISEFRYASIEGVAYSTRRAGIIMTFMGAGVKDLVDFRTFFRKSPVNDIVGALESLYGDTLRYWHGHRAEASMFLLTEYQSYLHWKRVKVEKAFQRYLGEYSEHEYISLQEAGVAFENPIHMLDRVEQKYRSYLAHTYKAISHGDLNVTNVLVDKLRYCWVIDFANTGESHIFRDYVEMETSIKFDAQESEDVQSLCALEAVLMTQRCFDQELVWSHGDPRIQKGFKAVKALRQFAYHAVGLARVDMIEFYIGLLYHTLNMLRFLDSHVSRQKKKCILYSASLICNALEAMM